MSARFDAALEGALTLNRPMSPPSTTVALNHLQVGRYAEYLAKMEFTLDGFDVYTAEVDDKGIDLVVRNECRKFHEAQVKAVR